MNNLKQNSICTKCGESKPIEAFAPRYDRKKTHHSACRDCYNVRKRADQKRWREKHRETSRDYHKEYYAKNKDRLNRLRINREYGLSAGVYNAMYEQQAGRCAICGVKHKVLCVDHCHDTHEIRGLLCKTCNFAIGLMQDDLDILKKAYDYLNTR